MRNFLFVSILFIFFSVKAQKTLQSFQVAFYNVENLFDTVHTSYKDDYEFSPTGKRHWITEKYWLKQHHISRVILGIGNWKGPDVIGLCEVENKQVLSDLTKKTNLKGYNYIHHESDDLRGIDVAFLYKKESFNPLFDTVIKIDLGKNSRPTRDILYVKGVTKAEDTLHFFVNHWSSRWGGQTESEGKRLRAAITLHNSLERLRDTISGAKIIVMGDFNDTPSDKSLERELVSKSENKLVNLSKSAEGVLGTIKYQHQWTIFDQIIVSVNLRQDSHDFTIYHPDWLKTEDVIYGGESLFRSFKGFEFIGGYSDHFPVFFYLE
jgi:predicted extracellular nuclease